MPLTKSNVRWFSSHKLADQLLHEFGMKKVFNFIDNFSSRIRRHDLMPLYDAGDNDDAFYQDLAALEKKLSDLISTPDLRFKVHLEMLIYFHYGKPLAESCYFMEGDDSLLPYGFDKINYCLGILKNGKFLSYF
jgi:hypothetical protein